MVLVVSTSSTALWMIAETLVQLMKVLLYDDFQLIGYFYEHGMEPTISSRKGAQFERRCN